MHPKDFFAAEQPRVRHKSCFVLMPFDSRFTPVYEAIQRAVTGPALRATCRRADEIRQSGYVLDDVLRSIAESEAVVADVSGSNPNVFYELGIAHTVKSADKVVLLTESEELVPFYVRPLRFIAYANDREGLRKLESDVAETLRGVFLNVFTVAGRTPYTHPTKLPGTDRCLYQFKIVPFEYGEGMAKFSLDVERYEIGQAPRHVHHGDFGELVEGPTQIAIPHTRWAIVLKEVVGESAMFQLIEKAPGET